MFKQILVPVDLAEVAQRQVQLFLVDPIGARHAARDEHQLLADRQRQIQRDEVGDLHGVWFCLRASSALISSRSRVASS